MDSSEGMIGTVALLTDFTCMPASRRSQAISPCRHPTVVFLELFHAALAKDCWDPAVAWPPPTQG